MRILMITDRLAIGGAETHIYELARYLRGAGHSVVLASAGGESARMLEKEGISHHTLPLDNKDPVSLLRARRGLLRLLETESYDIVHAHARLPAALCAPLCRHLAMPFVTTAHWVFDAKGWRGKLARWGEHTFAVSPDICRYLEEKYALARENITVIRNGIDTARFSPAAHIAGEGRLLHISRLDKGRAACAAALLQIAPRLAREGGFRALTVVGDGEEYPLLLAEAKRANALLGFPFVHMAGGQSDVLPYLQEADVFVGVSRAALEALACGLPVILAGDEGYLSLFSEENAWQAEESNFCCRGASPIEGERLYADICTAKRADGGFGRQFVEERYSAAQMGEAVLAVYLRLAANTLPRVTVCGYYGAGNTGDEAVLAALRARLREEGFAPPTVCSRGTISLPAARKGDVFVLGGGNLLQNETSTRSLLYYTHWLARAKQAGYRTVVLGGIGRLDARGEAIARQAIAHADGFLLRTPADIARLTRLAPQIKKPVRLLPDGALWVRAKKPNFVLPPNKLLILGLHGGKQEEEATLCALSLLARKHGLTAAAAVMQAARDEQEAARAARLTGGIVLPPLTPEELVYVLSCGALVYAGRLHALILAAVAGVPAICRADGGKRSDFAVYAAECGGERLLTCVEENSSPTAVFEAGERLLQAPPTKEERAAYLARLRAAGEGFSFANFFAGLA
ncbi:MAG: glycosyltransferase [Clostridia bacterium]|nr:glycosyltransferase [Clostridia bacterium]